MHNRTAALLLVLPISCVVAALVLPADPLHWFLLTIAIFAVSVALYFVGKRHGRKSMERTTPPPIRRGRRRLQFSLGALLGFTTLVACLFAEMTWQRQVDDKLNDQLARQRKDIDRVMQVSVSSVIGQAVRNVPYLCSSAGSGGDGKVAYESGYWALAHEAKLPDGFLDAITASISDRLRKLGATAEAASHTGARHPNDPDPFWSGREMQYHCRNMKGKIVLRLVPWGGKNSGGVLFMDHTLVHY
jgi:hypothetical protein